MVLGFVGSTGSTTISFILPAVFYLKLFNNPEKRSDRVRRALAWCLLVYGFTVMVRRFRETDGEAHLPTQIVCLALNTYEAIKSTHRVTRGKHHSDGGH
jgi:hypothetical protein